MLGMKDAIEEMQRKPHHTICIGRETLEKLARREAVTFTMEDGVRFTLIDADNFPRELAELRGTYEQP